MKISLRVLLLICFSAVSFASYVWGAGEGGELNAEYFSEADVRSAPIALPARKYLVSFLIAAVFFDLLRRLHIAPLRSQPLRVYGLFLLSMGSLFIFDGGESISYNLGAFSALVFLYYAVGCDLSELQQVMRVTATLLVFFLLAKNYYYPPKDFLLTRYGGGVNPNNHALYSSLAVLGSFLFFRRGFWGVTIFILIIGIGILNFAMAGSRTSFVGLMIGATLGSHVMWGGNAARSIILAIMIVMVGLVVVIPLEYFEYYFSRSDAVGGRVMGTFVVPLQATWDNWFVPYGLSGGAIVASAYGSPLDSGYLWILVCGGIIPAAIFLLFVSSMLPRLTLYSHRPLPAGANRRFHAICVSIVGYCLFFMIFEGGLRHILGWGDFIFLICIVSICHSDLEECSSG